jgi:hypothetical protein
VATALPLQLLLSVGLLSTAALPQNVLDIGVTPPGRGSTLVGDGGLMGAPAQPIAGSLGRSIVWADLDGDGFDELIVGAPDLPGDPQSGILNDKGHIYVVFGRAVDGNPNLSPVRDVAALGAGVGMDIRGEFGDLLGTSLARSGDIDGDGFEDVVIGAPGHNAPGVTGSGAAYILWGAADLKSAPVGAGMNGLISQGRVTRLLGASSFATLGAAVGGGSDVDNDGFDDILLGAPLASTGGLVQNGTVTVVFGNAGLKAVGDLDLAGLGVGARTVVSGNQNFQLLGSSVAGLGNYDPVLPATGGLEDLTAGDDVAIGAPGTLVNGTLFTGAAYVLRGRTTGPLPLALSPADFVGGDSDGHTWEGAGPGDQAGAWVGSAGDFISPGDGFQELLIGAPFNDGPGKSDPGAIYVLPGRVGTTNPDGFPLDDIGPGDGRVALRIFGAVTGDGSRGVFAGPAGDFNLDGVPELAVGFPAATALSSGSPVPEAGVVNLLDGVFIDPLANHTIDLGQVLASVGVFRLEGDLASTMAGASLALGDGNGDGDGDLAFGAPRASSLIAGSDLSGPGFSQTGRGHVLYGPLSRLSTIEPGSSHFQGPDLTLSVLELVAGPVSVTIDGVAAPIVSSTPGQPGEIVVQVPAPLAPGAGASVDVVLTTPLSTTTMVQAFTYTSFSITTGPVPSQTVPGLPLVFTGTGFSDDPDLVVTVNGAFASISALDPIAGTLTVISPTSQPVLMPLDIEFTSSNGDLTLVGAVSYLPFIVLDVSPLSGRQDSGIVLPPSPQIGFEGTPAIPVTIELETNTGSIPAGTVVQFGNATVGFKTGTVTSFVGETLVVDLPGFLLGQQDVLVDILITNTDGDLTFPDAFTYLAGDFRVDPVTENANFGSVPECLMAGEFKVGQKSVFVWRNYPAPETEFGVVFVSLDLFEPPLSFFGGLLGPKPDVIVTLPLSFVPIIGFEIFHKAELLAVPHGTKVYAQLVTQETDGLITVNSHSGILEMTVNHD